MASAVVRRGREGMVTVSRTRLSRVERSSAEDPTQWYHRYLDSDRSGPFEAQGHEHRLPDLERHRRLLEHDVVMARDQRRLTVSGDAKPRSIPIEPKDPRAFSVMSMTLGAAGEVAATNASALDPVFLTVR